jgi:hypothetical protein
LEAYLAARTAQNAVLLENSITATLFKLETGGNDILDYKTVFPQLHKFLFRMYGCLQGEMVVKDEDANEGASRIGLF